MEGMRVSCAHILFIVLYFMNVEGQYYWPSVQRTFSDRTLGFLPEKCPISCRCSKIRPGHELLRRWQELKSPEDVHILENAIEQGHRFRREFSWGPKATVSGRDMMCMGLREMPPSIPTDIVRLSMFGEEVSTTADNERVNDDQLNRPSGIRARGTSLQTSNQLSTIHKSAFRGNLNLMELSIVGNDVKYISPSEFEYLPNLVSLNLKNNNLKSLQPRTFRGLVQLEELSLSNNDLYELPIDLLDDVPMLKKLSLDGNHLRSLQIDAFRFLHQIQNLDLSSNDLTFLPRSLFYGNANLTELNIDDNLLEDIRSDWFSQSMRLKKLSMNRNGLFRLDPESMTALQSLTELHLSGNKISKIAHGTFHHTTSVRILDLSNNLIKSLQAGTFRIAKELRELNLSGNKLVEVRADLFGPSSALTLLDLSRNKIEILIKENFLSLNELKKLDLSQNSIDTIANGTFLGLRKLRELNLAQNKISVVDTSSFSVSVSRYVSQLTWLNLQHNLLDDISDQTFRTVPHLKFLNLAFNKIKSVSQKSFASQKQLNTLLLNNNLIAVIPNGVSSKLKNARDLNLGYNQLRALSNSALKGLVNLKEFSVQGNRLTQISASVLGEVPALTRANFSGNSLHYINMNIFAKNAKLVHLDLSWNVLTGIKVSLKNELKLAHLSLGNNKLTTLHSDISEIMATEGVLTLEGNPWRCDCQLSWLKFLVPIWQLSLHNGDLLQCHQPRKFSGKKILSLSQSQFRCSSKGSDNVSPVGSSARRSPVKERFNSPHQHQQNRKNEYGSRKYETHLNKHQASTPKPIQKIYRNQFLNTRSPQIRRNFPFVTSKPKSPYTEIQAAEKHRGIRPKPNILLNRRKSFGHPVVDGSNIRSTESPSTTTATPTTTFPDLRLNWWKTWTFAPKPVPISTSLSPAYAQIPLLEKLKPASRGRSNVYGNIKTLRDNPFHIPTKNGTLSPRTIKSAVVPIRRPIGRSYYHDTLNPARSTLNPRRVTTTLSTRSPTTPSARSSQTASHDNQKVINGRISKWWIPRPIYPTRLSTPLSPNTTPDPRAKYGKLQYHTNPKPPHKNSQRRQDYLPRTNPPNVLVTKQPTHNQETLPKLGKEVGWDPYNSKRFANSNSFNVIPADGSSLYKGKGTPPPYFRNSATRRPVLTTTTTTTIMPFKTADFSTPPKVLTLPSTAFPRVTNKRNHKKRNMPEKTSQRGSRGKQKTKTRKRLRPPNKVDLDCPTKSQWRMHFDKALIRRHKSEVKDFHVTILNSRRKPACNAVLLSDWWILTSASCVEKNLGNPGKLQDPAWVPNLHIKIGLRELNKVVGIVVHPLYLSRKSPQHNFALLKMKYESLMTKVATPPCVLPPDWFQSRPAWVVPGIASARFDKKKPRSDLQTVSVKVWETDCARNPVSCLRIQEPKLTAPSAFTDGAPLYLGYSETRWSLVGIGTSAQGTATYGQYLPVWIVLDWMKTVIVD